MVAANPKASCPMMGRKLFHEVCARSPLEPLGIVVEKVLLLTLERCGSLSAMVAEGRG